VEHRIEVLAKPVQHCKKYQGFP